MPDYRTMYDQSNFLFAFDLDGKDATVTIEKVEAGEVIGDGGKKSRKPILFFRGKSKRLALNKTNGKIIAAMYGKDPTKWVGKSITIYPTTTKFGSDTVECIRCRPTPPKQAGQPLPDNAEPGSAP